MHFAVNEAALAVLMVITLFLVVCKIAVSISPYQCTALHFNVDKIQGVRCNLLKVELSRERKLEFSLWKEFEGSKEVRQYFLAGTCGP